MLAKKDKGCANGCGCLLCGTPKILEKYLHAFGVNDSNIYELQKAALCGTVHILRKYL